VQQSTKVELFLNLKTTRPLGLTFLLALLGCAVSFDQFAAPAQVCN